VVGADNRIAIRPVRLAQRTDQMWVVQDGLKPGEQVVVEGQQNLKPGMLVKTKPFKGNTE
jgi:membrane fusion protein (multidrug efflux system)